jgi:hypothetical protein
MAGDDGIATAVPGSGAAGASLAAAGISEAGAANPRFSLGAINARVMLVLAQTGQSSRPDAAC